MLKKVLNTLGTQLLISIISLVLSIIYANMVGKDGVAEIAVIVLGFSIVSMVNTLLGSSSIIYLGSRESVFSILFLSYIWIVFFSITISFILSYYALISSQFTFFISLIAFFESLTTINAQVLLSRANIKKYNIVRLTQKLLLLIIVITLFFGFKMINVQSFVYAYLLSVSLVFILSFVYIYPYLFPLTFNDLKKLFLKKLLYGSQLQFSMLFSLLTNRISYYLIEKFFESSLGIFAQGVQLMENNLIVARSISLVQVSAIAGEKEGATAPEKLTLILFKLTGVITFSLVLVMVLIPESVYLFVFSDEFVGIKNVIYIYAPSIVIMGLSSILVHYFCGIAKYYYSTLVSFIGLVINIGACFYFIPIYGILGAGIAILITNCSTLLVLIVHFFKLTKANYSELLINAKDIKAAKEIFDFKFRKQG